MWKTSQTISVKRFDKQKLKLYRKIRDYPCHKQAVERHVKLVTEASAALSRFEREDEVINQKIHQENL